MDYLFIKIILVSACCGWCYVEKLTINYGLFDFLPQYYPRFLEKLLNCSYCLSGWFSMVGVLCFYQTFQYWTILNIFIAPCCTMALVGIVKQINFIYDKR